MARPPVGDWLTDFDHRDPAWVTAPHRIIAECRAAGIATTERYGGVYVPLRHADICAAANDATKFSSRSVVIREQKAEGFSNAPINSDPPQHTAERRVLMRSFGPEAIRALEPHARAVCRDLIAALNAKDGSQADAADDYAQHIPARVLAHLLGMPEADGDLFRRWIRQTLDDGIVDAAEADQAFREMTAYITDLVAARRRKPASDVTTALLSAVDAGELASDEIVLGMLRLLLLAGIDTTWSLIGASLLHLSTHHADRDRLAAEPSTLPLAIEEFLRVFSPVTMAREVTRPTTLAGMTLEPGRMVLLSFAAANRDPSVVMSPDSVEIGRAPNRHVAFGYGRHRCIGAGLARMETRIALEEWLSAYPQFRADASRTVSWSEGVVRGPRRVPVILSSGSSA